MSYNGNKGIHATDNNTSEKVFGMARNNKTDILINYFAKVNENYDTYKQKGFKNFTIILRPCGHNSTDDIRMKDNYAKNW